MLTAASIQKMGRKNVSVNGELTKQRANDVLKAATRKQKNEIDGLTGLKRVSLNRVYTTGNISAKIAVAIAQTLNLDPFYLTGDADERGECTDNLLISFLTTKNLPKLAQEIAMKEGSPSTAKTKDKSAASDVPQTGGGFRFPSAFSNSPELADAAADLPLEEAQQLLSALYIRARLGGDAAQLLDFVKRSLLS